MLKNTCIEFDVDGTVHIYQVIAQFGQNKVNGI